MHLRHSLKKSMPALHDFVCCCCFFFLSLSAASFIVVFHVTSWPPCWWMVNKRSLISSICLSASIFSFHHCYLCLPRLHENHLYHSSSQTTLQWSKIRLNQGFENKMQCCWGNKLPDPFNSYSTRGIFFSQLLEMAAPNKVYIDKYTREILAFILVYGREYY